MMVYHKDRSSGCNKLGYYISPLGEGHCTHYEENLENVAVATGLGKVSCQSNPKEGKCSNYHTIAHISDARKIVFKIFQARLQQYMNFELPDVQAGFRKGRRTRDQIANIH